MLQPPLWGIPSKHCCEVAMSIYRITKGNPLQVTTEMHLIWIDRRGQDFVLLLRLRLVAVAWKDVAYWDCLAVGGGEERGIYNLYKDTCLGKAKAPLSDSGGLFAGACLRQIWNPILGGCRWYILPKNIFIIYFGIMFSTQPEIWTCLDPHLQDLEWCSIEPSAPSAGHPKDFHQSNLGMQVGAPTHLDHPYPLVVLGVLAWPFLLGLQVENL